MIIGIDVGNACLEGFLLFFLATDTRRNYLTIKRFENPNVVFGDCTVAYYRNVFHTHCILSVTSRLFLVPHNHLLMLLVVLMLLVGKLWCPLLLRAMSLAHYHSHVTHMPR